MNDYLFLIIFNIIIIFLSYKFKKNIIIPNYFEPFKRENIKLRYAIWPDKKTLPIFKGDCDQDRPNVI